ncbi:sugar phosphate nucleotidyltransferase [Verrucomicrobiota bacterium]
MDRAQVPVFVLCGGLGTRLQEQTGLKPKAMVTVGDQPILMHVLRSYRKHGFKRFVLCTGFKSELIKEYFLNYPALNSDFTVDLETSDVVVHRVHHDLDLKVTVAYTGELTMTGARVARAAERYLGDSEHFGVTYCDGLTDANLGEEFDFHVSHGKIGTVLGVVAASRFGEFRMEGTLVTDFVEKPEFEDKWINGGYFFFRREFLDYLSTSEDCILERAPLVRLSRDRELHVHRNTGFWACMDTLRDCNRLNELWDKDNAPWRV